MVDHVLSTGWTRKPTETTAVSNDERAQASSRWLDVTTRMATGDPDAFRDFYDQCFDLMMREANHCTGKETEFCFDVVHDAMLRLIRAMKPISNERQIANYARAAVRSVAYDRFRRERRQLKLHQDLASNSSSNSPTNAGKEIDMAADNHARIGWLAEQLQQLDPQLKQIIDWRYRLGWTLSAIATRLGIKSGAVDGRIRRAIEKLRSRAENRSDD